MGIGRVGEVVVDCHDPMRLAEFWQRLLGGYFVRSGSDWVQLEPPAGVTIAFQRVPEPKSVKNRLHLDIDVRDLDQSIAAAESYGAARVGDVITDELAAFQTMTDPEGNEFCLVDQGGGDIA